MNNDVRFKHIKAKKREFTMTKHSVQILCSVITDDVTTPCYNDVTTIQNVQVKCT